MMGHLPFVEQASGRPSTCALFADRRAALARLFRAGGHNEIDMAEILQSD
jgi:hypothetical protein